MVVKKKKDENKKTEEILDFEFGKLSIGGLFNGIDKLVDFAEKLEKAGGEIRKEGEFKVNGSDRKGVFGFSVRNMVDKNGKKSSVVQPFGNIKKTAKGTVVEDTREPIVDVFEEGDTVQIVVELPGVSETEIEYTVKEDVLILSTTGARKYSKEILLPYPVSEKQIKRSYKAGVLELKLGKKT